MFASAKFGVAGLVLSCLLGVFAGMGSYTFYYAKGYSYLSNDPRACVNCHIMRPQYEGWQHASHHAVAACNDCHTPHDLIGKYYTKAENGYHHSKAFTLQNFHEPIKIREKNERILLHNCVRCHGEFTSEIREHAKGGELNCVRCHADVGHGPVR
ncbi:MAG: cytochrome c nitrite reductase small subunit [bacterium]|jgi:cytochrome c nitrite reductase small subunit